MPVPTKPFTTPQNTGLLSFLQSTNDFLETVPYTITKFFDRIYESGERVTQKGVDMVCEWCSWRVNTWVEASRQGVIKALHSQYSDATGMLEPMTSLQQGFSNPMKKIGAVAAFVKKIISILVGPLKAVIEFITQLFNELARLARNLANIMSVLPPPPPSPEINYDKFKLSIKSIGASDITTDPSNMPSPEELFKNEPIVPFSNEYFAVLGDDAQTSYKQQLPFYSLPSTYQGPLVNMSDLKIE